MAGWPRAGPANRPPTGPGPGCCPAAGPISSACAGGTRPSIPSAPSARWSPSLWRRLSCVPAVQVWHQRRGRLGPGGRSWGGPMSRINDVGGMQGFPPVDQEADEPAFHADWEAHVFALNRALIGRGVYSLDEFRDAIERMPPQEYLASSYYEKWFRAITTLLAEKGVLTEEEMAGG